MVAEDFASSIYVYVLDYEQPIVPMNEKNYYTTNENSPIPCKPAYPDIEIKLCNKDEQCLTKHDPTKGFTIPKTFIIPEDVLYCKSGNLSYKMNILPTEDNIARPPEHISRTCTFSFVPGVKVVVKVNATSKNQQRDDNDQIQVETPVSEMIYPITVSMTSSISRTLLNTQDCEAINFHCNVTGMTPSVLIWNKNGLPVGSRKNILSVSGSQTIVSIEGHMGHDNPDLGEYECKAENVYETTQTTPQLETMKGLSDTEKTEGHGWKIFSFVFLFCVCLFFGFLAWKLCPRSNERPNSRTRVITDGQNDSENFEV
ncbi:uncharacterized protein LOC118468341 [Anopheles albimanus]|uniref:uncharacterized protein LOC118468341 n=1 Tax=Anopheles albimanus TaxID=7167 RepID=UPI00163DF83C|nr:uncharacterized protein LOC118468341 [Anopheles albimanus]